MFIFFQNLRFKFIFKFLKNLKTQKMDRKRSFFNKSIRDFH